jgi:lipoate-protein ligase B
VTNDLAAFDAIAPCGIEGARVTRVADLVEDPPSVKEFGREVAEGLARVAGLELAEAATRSREKVSRG